MNDNIFSKACTETLEILNNTKQEDYNQIPKQLIDLLLRNQDRDYKFKIDKEKDLREQKLLPETIDLLAYIYRKYWCNAEEKIKFDKTMIRNEEIYQKRISDLFRKN